MTILLATCTVALCLSMVMASLLSTATIPFAIDSPCYSSDEAKYAVDALSADLSARTSSDGLMVASEKQAKCLSYYSKVVLDLDSHSGCILAHQLHLVVSEGARVCSISSLESVHGSSIITAATIKTVKKKPMNNPNGSKQPPKNPKRNPSTGGTWSYKCTSGRHWCCVFKGIDQASYCFSEWCRHVPQTRFRCAGGPVIKKKQFGMNKPGKKPSPINPKRKPARGGTWTYSCKSGRHWCCVFKGDDQSSSCFREWCRDVPPRRLRCAGDHVNKQKHPRKTNPPKNTPPNTPKRKPGTGGGWSYKCKSGRHWCCVFWGDDQVSSCFREWCADLDQSSLRCHGKQVRGNDQLDKK